MGGSAYRGSHFCLGKSKQNRVPHKTRARRVTIKEAVFLKKIKQLNVSRLAQTVVRDELEAKSIVFFL